MLGHRHAESGAHGVGGDVVVGRADAARREDIVAGRAQGVQRPDDLILTVADGARLHQVDPQGRQKAGDGVQVRVPGPAGQDFVADDQDSGGRSSLSVHAPHIGSAPRRVIGAA
ncbi:hypothetical protein D3C72_1769550 [compost metagenome]